MWLWLSTALALTLPEKTMSTTLENGLSVLIVPMDSDVVAVQTWVRVGSGDEVNRGESGYAHFFEHLMFHGTPSRSRSERQRSLLELGAEENAWTSDDFTCYHLIAPHDSVEEILKIEADRFQNLSLTDAGVRREAGAVLGEFRKGRSSVNRVAYEGLLELVYKKHPYRHSTIGLESDVRSMPDGHMRAEAFYSAHYRPEKTTLVVVGRVDPESILKVVKSEYGVWKTSEEEPSVIPTEPKQRKARRTTMNWANNPSARQIQLAYPIAYTNTEQSEKYPLEVVARWLESADGPIYPELIQVENAPVIDFSADVDLRRDTGMFWVRAILSPSADIDAVEAHITSTLMELSGLEDEMVKQHSEALARGWLLRLSSPDIWANRLGYQMSRGGDLGAWVEIPERYRAVSIEAVQQYSAEIFQPSQLNVVWVNP